VKDPYWQVYGYTTAKEKEKMTIKITGFKMSSVYSLDYYCVNNE